MGLLVPLFFTLVVLAFAKDDEREYKMKIYGDCYYYHIPTWKLCLRYFWKCNPDFCFYWTEYYTVEKKGKKYNVRYIWCRNNDEDPAEVVRLYIYMSPEDIKLCNQKPEPEHNINVEVKK